MFAGTLIFTVATVIAPSGQPPHTPTPRFADPKPETCVPITCAQLGKNCGIMSDGCGSVLACGSCKPPDFCGGGSLPNECGNPDSGVSDAAADASEAASGGADGAPIEDASTEDASAGGTTSTGGTT